MKDRKIDTDSIMQRLKERRDLVSQSNHFYGTITQKYIDFDQITLKVVLNQNCGQKRITTSFCPFCDEKQEGHVPIQLGDDYSVFFPPCQVCDFHFLGIHKQHISQRLSTHLSDVLMVSQNMEGFSVLYDGKHCGALVKDHFHISIIKNEMLPVVNKCLQNLNLSLKILFNDVGRIGCLSIKMHQAIYIESDSKKWLINVVYLIRKKLKNSWVNRNEPMMNVITYYGNNKWKLLVFPRIVYCPYQYYDNAEHHINILPSSLEMGGVFVVSDQHDFDAMSDELIKDIYQQVNMSSDNIVKFILDLIKKLNN